MQRRYDRIRIQLPQPVEIDSTVWQARAWQTIIDALDHLDECVDELKDAKNEFHAEMTVLVTAIQERSDAHEAGHRERERAEKAERGVWATQYRWAREIARASFEVAKIAAGVGALRLLGIL